MTLNWRLHVINQGPRLLSAARDNMVDENEAHLFVHTVISEALGRACGADSLHAMDFRLDGLMRGHAEQRAEAVA